MSCSISSCMVGAGGGWSLLLFEVLVLLVLFGSEHWGILRRISHDGVVRRGGGFGIVVSVGKRSRRAKGGEIDLSLCVF